MKYIASPVPLVQACHFKHVFCGRLPRIHSLHISDLTNLRIESYDSRGGGGHQYVSLIQRLALDAHQSRSPRLDKALHST